VAPLLRLLLQVEVVSVGGCYNTGRHGGLPVYTNCCCCCLPLQVDAVIIGGSYGNGRQEICLCNWPLLLLLLPQVDVVIAGGYYGTGPWRHIVCMCL
jgi:hypothetical protein